MKEELIVPINPVEQTTSPENSFEDQYRQKRLKEISEQLRMLHPEDIGEDVFGYALGRIEKELKTFEINGNEKIKAAFDKANEIGKIWYNNKVDKSSPKVIERDWEKLCDLVEQCL